MAGLRLRFLANAGRDEQYISAIVSSSARGHQRANVRVLARLRIQLARAERGDRFIDVTRDGDRHEMTRAELTRPSSGIEIRRRESTGWRG